MGMNHNGKDLSDQINEIFSSGNYKTAEEANQAVRELKQREQNRSKYSDGEIHISPCSILPTNQTPKDPSKRKFLGDGLKGLAYIAGIAYGSALLQACGPDSSGSSNNNGNGGNGTIIDHDYIVSEFERLGWDIHDGPDESPPYNDLNYPADRIMFKTSYESNKGGIQNVFAAEDTIIRYLLDGSLANDELRVSYVTDSANVVVLGIDTTDTNIGVNGVYSVSKQFPKEQADVVRDV